MAMLRPSTINGHFNQAMGLYNDHLVAMRKFVKDPLMVEGVYAKAQQYALPAYNLHRQSMEALNELIGIRHVLEMGTSSSLNTEAYSYTDYNIDEVKTAIQLYRNHIEVLAKVVNEMCNLCADAAKKEGIDDGS